MSPFSSSYTLPVAPSFGERRSASHDLARFSLDLDSERRASSKPVRQPYPSPPMSYSPPPQLPNGTQQHPVRRPYDLSPLYDERFGYGQEHNPQPSRHPSTVGSDAYSQPFQSMDHGKLSPNGLPNVPDVGRSPFLQQQSAYSHPQSARKPKSHVASACVNCKKAHLACDVRRPCPRCIGLNKQDTCVDVQHKKRGRPRLRDEKSHSFEVSQVSVQRPSYSSPIPSPTAIPNSYRQGSHRVLKSQSSNDSFRSGYSRKSSLNLRDDYQPTAPMNGYFDSVHEHERANIAFLTVDLAIVDSTDSAKKLLSHPLQEEHGRICGLLDIVHHSDSDKVYQLRSRILQDAAELNAGHPGTVEVVHSAWQHVSHGDIWASTHGRVRHTEVFHLRQYDGNYIKFKIEGRLVVEPAFWFVAAVFSRMNEIPPPLQLQNHGGSGAVVGHGSLQTSPALPPPIHSPNFATGAFPGHQRPNERYGASYGQNALSPPIPSPLDSRPRSISLQTDSTLPPLMGPYARTDTPPGLGSFPNGHRLTPPVPAPRNERGDPHHGVQLPPLLNHMGRPTGHDDRRQAAGRPDEGDDRRDMPRRERIAVEEMLG